MSLTFLHTADWQIGKPFARIADEQKRVQVRQERLHVIQRLGVVAKEKQASFIVVSGDMFDSNTPDKATVSAACAAIGALGVPVYAIPGNHDHGGPGGLWEQTFFQKERAALAPNLQILLKAEPFELEQAVLLPCPLLRKHESSDTTAWLRGVDLATFVNKPRIGIAHGSVQGFGAAVDEDEDAGTVNHLDLSRLPPEQLDYLALGDWHGMKDVSIGALTAWYSGTPEPDRYPRGMGNVPGNVLLVTIEQGRPIHVQAVGTGRLGWHEMNFHLAHDADVARLDAALSSLFQNRAGQDLLRLSLQGSLGMAAWTELEACLETWSSRLLRLRLHQHVTVAPTESEMNDLTQRADAPLSANVASQLLQESQSSDLETAEVARQALRLLHVALG